MSLLFTNGGWGGGVPPKSACGLLVSGPYAAKFLFFEILKIMLRGMKHGW